MLVNVLVLNFINIILITHLLLSLVVSYTFSWSFHFGNETALAVLNIVGDCLFLTTITIEFPRTIA